MQGEAIKKCKIINSYLSTQVRGPNYVYPIDRYEVDPGES